MRRLFTVFVSLGLLLVNSSQVRAQTSVEVKDVSVTYIFGEQISFVATLQPVLPVKEAYLFYQSEGGPNTYMLPVTPTNLGSMEITADISGGVMRPFTRVYFWYRLLLADDQVINSARYYFQYDDNRFPWETLQDDRLRVHWYAGEMDFGQAAFNAAHVGLENFEALLPRVSQGLVDIFIYNSPVDVQETLRLGGYSVVSGHTNPEWGVVLVAISPDTNWKVEMSRLIQHELAHVLLYRETPEAYTQLPAWLVEGVALVSQVDTDPDYQQILSASEESDALLAMSDLCPAFPTDAAGAMLAYAEAESFTRYLVDTFGSSGLTRLVSSFTEGYSCEEGPQRALGNPLSVLEQHWQERELGQAASASALQQLLPYFLVLFALLLLPAAWLVPGLRKRGNNDKNKLV